MANKSLNRMVWRLSLPIILVEATETLDHLIDTLFLGRVGITELGALAVADTLLLLFLIVPLSVVDAMQIITARRAGERRSQELGAAFNQGMVLALGLCLLGMGALKLVSPLLAGQVVDSASIGEAVNGYLQLDAYSLPLVGITFGCSALLTSLGRTWVLIPASLIVIVVDVVLNYVFIFGHFGFPALGMRVAALGSIGAELAAAGFLCAYLARSFRRSGYGLFRFRGSGRSGLKWLRELSVPLATQGFVQEFRWFGFFLIVERMGAEPLAMANIAFTCCIVFSIPGEGFAETVCSMVSRYIGRNRPDRVGALLQSATGAAMLATLPFILLAVLAPQWVLALFAPGEKLMAQGQDILRVMAIGMLIATPAELWFTAVEGAGDALVALGIDLLTTAFMLGFAYVAAVSWGWPIAGVWLAVPMTWVAGWGAAYAWMKSGFWKRDIVPGPSQASNYRP
jgi:putative MATE family efflux protein